MNFQFVSPFLTSILNVLSTMASLAAKHGKPSYKTSATACGDVSGIIGMASEQAKGTLAVTFTEPVALEITKRMLGDELTEIDHTVIDMVGEITNMVTGGAKSLLSEKGYRFDMAIPSVISGKNHVIHHKSKVPVILVPFHTDAGDFFVEICFE